MNLDTFQIADLVIHDVPLPNEEGLDVILTDAPIDLDPDLRRYFRRKIIDSLKKRGLDVVADTDETPIAREAVRAILASPDELVPRSHELARHLFAIQNKRNSEGLVAVATGTVDEGDVVSVLKLEREQGLRLQIVREGGRTLADIEHLRNLTLTDKTKVFKTSILRLDDPGDELSLTGRVSDDQRGLRAGEGVANFFLSRFLGCRLELNPEVATRDFVTAVEEFINGLDDQERQAEYHIALLATLQDQQLDVSPAAFAEANLHDDDLDPYLAALEKVGLNPDTVFEKDLKLARAKGFKWYFEHGMLLIGSRDDVEQGRLVVPPQEAAPEQPFEIYDAVKRLVGR
ncbi:MAG TPA: nucleoid-associated protein [Gaiellaceae bacterium]